MDPEILVHPSFSGTGGGDTERSGSCGAPRNFKEIPIKMSLCLLIFTISVHHSFKFEVNNFVQSRAKKNNPVITKHSR